MLETLSALTQLSLVPCGGIRMAIQAMHESILANCDNLAQDLPVRHFFAPGQYCREITIPAGVVVVGRIHKHAHVNILTKGSAFVLTPQGGVEFLQAPCTFISEPLTRRAVFPLTDVVWSTVHNTNAITPEDAIADLTVEDYTDWEISGEFWEVSE